MALPGAADDVMLSGLDREVSRIVAGAMPAERRRTRMPRWTRWTRWHLTSVMVVVLIGCSGGAGAPTAVSTSPTTTDSGTVPSSGPPSSPPASESAAAVPTLTATTEPTRSAAPGAIQIEMTPDALTPRYRPDAVSVPSGTVRFYLTSIPVSGTFGPHHDMVIGPQIGTVLAASGSVQPGTSAMFTVEGLAPGTYQFWCTTNTGHGAHHTLGMVGTLTVT
jgi:plastocyanin